MQHFKGASPCAFTAAREIGIRSALHLSINVCKTCVLVLCIVSIERWRLPQAFQVLDETRDSIVQPELVLPQVEDRLHALLPSQ